MIIFGTRGVKFTIEKGRFQCPQCEGNRPFKHKKVTNFFTLYFIPIIPLGKAGEYVECQSCKGTFVTRVLDYNPEKKDNEFQSIYEEAMRHSMIMMMLADGIIDDDEMIAVHKIINKFGYNDMTMDELVVFVKEVEAKNEPVEKYLSKVTPFLNEHGKEVIIKCGMAVAASDGHIDETEIQLIHEMATIMEMSNSHFKGIIADLTKEEPTFSEN